jgi:hypothetical protein
LARIFDGCAAGRFSARPTPVSAAPNLGPASQAHTATRQIRYLNPIRKEIKTELDD